MEYRYTANAKVKTKLKELGLAERKKIIISACRYIDKLAIDQGLDFVAQEELESEQIFVIENLLFLRDELEDTLVLLRELARDFIEAENPEILQAIMQAESKACSADEMLLARPDIIAAALPALAGIRTLIKLEITPKQWWFSKNFDNSKWLEDRLAMSSK